MKILSYTLCLQLFILNSAIASSLPADTTLPPTIDTSYIHAGPVIDTNLFRTRPAAVKDYRPTVAGMTVPILFISYGFWALKNPTLQSLNHSTKAELREDHPNFSTHIDNYLEYAPALGVYALNLAGIHGEHNFRDRTMILGISTLLMSGTVGILKNSTHVLRPDGSSYNSFPSGHTATAFMGAEFMRMEYKDVSPWYGVAGYAAAATTGALRMYNNRHWLSDVVTGAGIGILSTKAAYFLYPKLQKVFAPKSSMNVMVMPNYNAEWKTFGLGLVLLPKK
ncbi:phosphatase PAP2 family protein [Chitinophaga oryziterrae]|uniref:Phosphatase PAP2 family protein n=1 Tax=Chitinophaga oryziterrae TaxID=1031224 RepID=A0A6N8JJ77_9BACT|nr:phosphatase PAP2 family protein [Chitinophaga oryziterrae]MVT44439.1 phosphatase PAP2 family protein [Chitinophaga oryziterrae]